ncbi:MAG: S8 family serine peptidase, partial [Saprospiraceae bacterium]
MKSNNFLWMAFVSVMVMTVSCVNENNIRQESTQNSSEYKFVPDQLLIKFKSAGLTERATINALSLIKGEIVEIISTNAMKSANSRKGIKDGQLMLVNSKLGTLEAIAQLKDLTQIEYAEPNFIYTHFSISNDPYYTNGSLWGMYGDATIPSNQYGSQAAKAWDAGHTGANNVYIGIIDEGYMYTHEDLSANAGTNPGEIPGNGIDDDNNGYKDDVYGWDFNGNDNTVFDGVDDDHGTHVAGTIGGVGGNNIGVAGIVWTVKLVSAKFLGRNGGTTA